MKLRTGDQVQIIAGKDRGRKGKITKIFPQKGSVIVEGLNQYKRHLKRRSDQQPGGIVAVERPLDVSKVQLVCPTCKKLTRVGFKVSEHEKQRICKKCQAPITKKS
jgi:large subunit ribosomal protein L24